LREIPGAQVFYRAAGGVVVHGGHVLTLERPSRAEVRLPKGHIEEGEGAATAALREVREETGYRHLAIVADLGCQRITFIDPYRKRKVVRDEHYFLMSLESEQPLAQQAPEEQFQPKWLPPSDALGRLTFEAERQVVQHAVRWIAENGWP
jgi:8-oxo-dGTP diphosphatase